MSNELALKGTRVERVADGRYLGYVRGNIQVERDGAYRYFATEHEAYAVVKAVDEMLDRTPHPG